MKCTNHFWSRRRSWFHFILFFCVRHLQEEGQRTSEHVFFYPTLLYCNFENLVARMCQAGLFSSVHELSVHLAVGCGELRRWTRGRKEERVARQCRPCSANIYIWFFLNTFKPGQMQYRAIWCEADDQLLGEVCGQWIIYPRFVPYGGKTGAQSICWYVDSGLTGWVKVTERGDRLKKMSEEYGQRYILKGDVKNIFDIHILLPCSSGIWHEQNLEHMADWHPLFMHTTIAFHHLVP